MEDSCPLRADEQLWSNQLPEDCRTYLDTTTSFTDAGIPYDHFGDDPEACMADTYTEDVQVFRGEGAVRFMGTLDICELHDVEVGNNTLQFICKKSI